MRSRCLALTALATLVAACLGIRSAAGQERVAVLEREAAHEVHTEAGGSPSRRAREPEGQEITAEGASPRAEPGDPESAILARIPSVDLRARVPAGWFGSHLAQRPLEPARRRARLPRRCRTTGGYREHCSGPRLLAEPSGSPVLLAQHLGLGRDQTVMQLLGGRRPLPEWIAATAGLDGEAGLTYPVPGGRNGRGFGFTRNGSMRHRRHDGLDIQAAAGSPIVAARGGLVAYADNGLSGMGNLLVILHEGGDTTAYAHCQRILVQPGEVVSRGEHVAEVGRTGFAPAPHLHFEWRDNGWTRDPARVLLRREPASHAAVTVAGR